MSDKEKTREQLIDELKALREKIAGLEKSNNRQTSPGPRYDKLLEEVDTALSMAHEHAHDIERLVAERTASLIALNIADRMTNPSVVIGMMCRRMLKDPALGKAERDNLEVILHECGKLEEIIHEFNALIEKRRSVFSYEDINELVRDAVVLIKREAEDKGVNLVTEISEVPLKINMDRNVLRTAVHYILKNALESTPPGGTIRASTSESAGNVYLTIIDTGRGISEKDIGHVFERFYTARTDGAGMGLPFVKHIIEEHYGDIRIESEEGLGTKLTIKFPVRWLRLSEGKIEWEHPMLPVPWEKEEYPLQTETAFRKPAEGVQEQKTD